MKECREGYEKHSVWVFWNNDGFYVKEIYNPVDNHNDQGSEVSEEISFPALATICSSTDPTNYNSVQVAMNCTGSSEKSQWRIPG